MSSLALAISLAATPPARAGLDVSLGGDDGIGVSADIGGSSGVSADIGIGGSSGISADAEVGIGGDDGVSASADVGIGGDSGTDVQADAALGGRQGTRAGLSAGTANTASGDTNAGSGSGGTRQTGLTATIDLGTTGGIDTMIDIATGGSGTTPQDTTGQNTTGAATTGGRNGVTTAGSGSSAQPAQGDGSFSFAAAGPGSRLATIRPEQMNIITVSQLDRRGQASAASLDRQVAMSGGWVDRLRKRIAANPETARFLARDGWIPGDVIGFYARNDGSYWFIVDDRA